MYSKSMLTKQNPVFIMVLLVTVVVSIIYFFLSQLPHTPDIIGVPTTSPTQSKRPPDENFVRCTMEVRKCPDGSYTGRVAPNCSFAPCPKSDRY